MSRALIDLARRFADGEIDAEPFAAGFIARWREERDGGMLEEDPAARRRALSDIFIACDNFCADDELRDTHDLDAAGLRRQVHVLVEQAG